MDCIVKDDVGMLGLESTVISLVGGIKILRQGAIGKKMIEVVLGREVESAQVSRALGASQNDAGAISHRQRSKVRLYQRGEATLYLSRSLRIEMWRRSSLGTISSLT